MLAYDDPRRSIGKRVRIENGRITAIRLAGETLARHWLQTSGSKVAPMNSYGAGCSRH